MDTMILLKENIDNTFSEESVANTFINSSKIYEVINQAIEVRNEKLKENPKEKMTLEGQFPISHMSENELLYLYRALKFHHQVYVDIQGGEIEYLIWRTDRRSVLTPKLMILLESKETGSQTYVTQDNVIRVNFRK